MTSCAGRVSGSDGDGSAEETFGTASTTDAPNGETFEPAETADVPGQGAPLLSAIYAADFSCDCVELREAIEKTSPFGGGEKVIITGDSDIFDLRVVTVSYDDELNFYYDDLVFGLAWLPAGKFYIEYDTIVPDTIPREAILYKDKDWFYDDRNEYAFLLSYNGRDGSVELTPVTLLERENRDDAAETVPVMFYNYKEVNFNYTDNVNYTGLEVDIPSENFLSEAAKQFYLVNKISVDKLYYEGNRLIADLNKTEAAMFNSGTAGGSIRTGLLLRTLASFPGVTEIQVLLGGRKDVYSDHYDFSGIFSAEDLSRIKDYIADPTEY